MSLIHLANVGPSNSPSNFVCEFPNMVRIPPNAEICLSGIVLKEALNSATINVSESNSRFMWHSGTEAGDPNTTNPFAPCRFTLTHGLWTDTRDYTTMITSVMNAQCQETSESRGGFRCVVNGAGSCDITMQARTCPLNTPIPEQFLSGFGGDAPNYTNPDPLDPLSTNITPGAVGCRTYTSDDPIWFGPNLLVAAGATKSWTFTTYITPAKPISSCASSGGILSGKELFEFKLGNVSAPSLTPKLRLGYRIDESGRIFILDPTTGGEIGTTTRFAVHAGGVDTGMRKILIQPLFLGGSIQISWFCIDTSVGVAAVPLIASGTAVQYRSFVQNWYSEGVFGTNSGLRQCMSYTVANQTLQNRSAMGAALESGSTASGNASVFRGTLVAQHENDPEEGLVPFSRMLQQVGNDFQANAGAMVGAALAENDLANTLPLGFVGTIPLLSPVATLTAPDVAEPFYWWNGGLKSPECVVVQMPDLPIIGFLGATRGSSAPILDIVPWADAVRHEGGGWKNMVGGSSGTANWIQLGNTNELHLSRLQIRLTDIFNKELTNLFNHSSIWIKFRHLSRF